MALRLLEEPEWEQYLICIGIPNPFAKEYARVFHAEQIPKSHINHLSDKDLRDTFGVKLIGHKIIIRNADTEPETSHRTQQNLIRHQAPQLKPIMTPSSFRAFVSHWQIYKKLVGIPPESTNTASQIFSVCCTDHPEIRRTIEDHRSDHSLLSETQYMEMLRRLLTAYANPEAYCNKFFTMTQNSNESCQDWLKRLQEVAPDCDFTIKCDHKEGTIHKFEDKLLRTKFILGTYNEHIKNDLLAKSYELTTLNQVYNHASRMEATALTINTRQVADLSLEDSSEGEEISKLSTYRRTKRVHTTSI